MRAIRVRYDSSIASYKNLAIPTKGGSKEGASPR